MDFREEGWGERMLRALCGEPDDAEAPGAFEPQWPLMLAWWLWFAGIVLLVSTLIVMSGCAQAPAVPLCERPQFELAVDEAAGRRLYALDEENMRALWAMVRGLATGTCRMPPAPGA
jgi:hypothetical protein